MISQNIFDQVCVAARDRKDRSCDERLCSQILLGQPRVVQERGYVLYILYKDL